MDDWNLSWNLLFRVGVFLFAAYLAYHFLVGVRADFVIRLRPGHVEYKGFPLAHQAAVTRLLLEDLGLRKSATILGARQGGRIRIWFRGPLGQADRQRIRNFITTRL